MEFYATFFRCSVDRVKTGILVLGLVLIVIGFLTHLVFLMGFGCGTAALGVYAKIDAKARRTAAPATQRGKRKVK